MMEAKQYAKLALTSAIANNDPELYSVYDTLGSILRRCGQVTGAVKAFNQSKALNPSFAEEADRKIQKCRAFLMEPFSESEIQTLFNDVSK